MLERAYVEIGNICNLSCSFCHGTKREPRQMSEAEFREVLAKLSGRVKNIYLHLLGEPFFHPKLFSFLEIAREFDFRISITTNGTLLGGQKDVIAGFSDVVHKVCISLHSLEANNAKLYENYIKTIADFSRTIAETGIYSVLRLWNLDSAEKSGANDSNGRILELLKEEFPQPWQKRRSGFRLSKNIFLEYAEIFTWPEDSADEPREYGFCHGLSQQIGILADGTAVPCCLDAEGSIPLGNIFSSTLEEILSSERAQKMARGFVCGRLEESLCRTCSYSKRFKTK